MQPSGDVVVCSELLLGSSPSEDRPLSSGKPLVSGCDGVTQAVTCHSQVQYGYSVLFKRGLLAQRVVRLTD